MTVNGTAPNSFYVPPCSSPEVGPSQPKQEDSKQSIPKNDARAHLLAELQRREIIDENGYLLKGQLEERLPHLTEDQIKSIADYFDPELIDYLREKIGEDLDEIKIVGGFVRKLLFESREYCRTVFLNWGIKDIDALLPKALFEGNPRKLPDCDLRFHLKSNDREKLQDTLRLVTDFFQGDTTFKKFGIPKNTKDKFAIATHKNLELLFVQSFVRYHLFLHELEIHFDTKAVTTDKKISPAQAFIDNLTRILHVDETETVNEYGWPMLLSYMIRGWTLGDRGIMDTLFKKICEKTETKEELPGIIHFLIHRCLKNHHFNDPLAAIAMIYSACTHHEQNAEMLWANFDSETRRVLKEQVRDSNKDNLLWTIFEFIRSERGNFELASSIVHFAALFRLLGCEGLFEAAQVSSEGEPALQLRIEVEDREYFLLLPRDFSQAIQNLKKSPAAHAFYKKLIQDKGRFQNLDPAEWALGLAEDPHFAHVGYQLWDSLDVKAKRKVATPLLKILASTNPTLACKVLKAHPSARHFILLTDAAKQREDSQYIFELKDVACGILRGKKPAEAIVPFLATRLHWLETRVVLNDAIRGSSWYCQSVVEACLQMKEDDFPDFFEQAQGWLNAQEEERLKKRIMGQIARFIKEEKKARADRWLSKFGHMINEKETAKCKLLKLKVAIDQKREAEARELWREVVSDKSQPLELLGERQFEIYDGMFPLLDQDPGKKLQLSLMSLKKMATTEGHQELLKKVIKFFRRPLPKKYRGEIKAKASALWPRLDQEGKLDLLAVLEANQMKQEGIPAAEMVSLYLKSNKVDKAASLLLSSPEGIPAEASQEVAERCFQEGDLTGTIKILGLYQVPDGNLWLRCMEKVVEGKDHSLKKLTLDVFMEVVVNREFFPEGPLTYVRGWTHCLELMNSLKDPFVLTVLKQMVEEESSLNKLFQMEPLRDEMRKACGLVIEGAIHLLLTTKKQGEVIDFVRKIRGLLTDTSSIDSLIMDANNVIKNSKLFVFSLYLADADTTCLPYELMDLGYELESEGNLHFPSMFKLARTLTERDPDNPEAWGHLIRTTFSGAHSMPSPQLFRGALEVFFKHYHQVKDCKGVRQACVREAFRTLAVFAGDPRTFPLFNEYVARFFDQNDSSADLIILIEELFKNKPSSEVAQTLVLDFIEANLMGLLVNFPKQNGIIPLLEIFTFLLEPTRSLKYETHLQAAGDLYSKAVELGLHKIHRKELARIGLYLTLSPLSLNLLQPKEKVAVFDTLMNDLLEHPRVENALRGVQIFNASYNSVLLDHKKILSYFEKIFAILKDEPTDPVLYEDLVTAVQEAILPEDTVIGLDGTREGTRTAQRICTLFFECCVEAYENHTWIDEINSDRSYFLELGGQLLRVAEDWGAYRGQYSILYALADQFTDLVCRDMEQYEPRRRTCMVDIAFELICSVNNTIQKNFGKLSKPEKALRAKSMIRWMRGVLACPSPLPVDVEGKTKPLKAYVVGILNKVLEERVAPPFENKDKQTLLKILNQFEKDGIILQSFLENQLEKRSLQTSMTGIKYVVKAFPRFSEDPKVVRKLLPLIFKHVAFIAAEGDPEDLFPQVLNRVFNLFFVQDSVKSPKGWVPWCERKSKNDKDAFQVLYHYVNELLQADPKNEKGFRQICSSAGAQLIKILESFPNERERCLELLDRFFNYTFPADNFHRHSYLYNTRKLFYSLSMGVISFDLPPGRMDKWGVMILQVEYEDVLDQIEELVKNQQRLAKENPRELIQKYTDLCKMISGVPDLLLDCERVYPGLMEALHQLEACEASISRTIRNTVEGAIVGASFECLIERLQNAQKGDSVLLKHMQQLEQMKLFSCDEQIAFCILQASHNHVCCEIQNRDIPLDQRQALTQLFLSFREHVDQQAGAAEFFEAFQSQVKLNLKNAVDNGL